MNSETWCNWVVKKWIAFTKVMMRDLLLISSSSSLTDDSFASEPLVTPCTLFNNNKRNTVKALIDTDATEYAFINEITAHIICKNLEISLISLLKPKSVKSFDEYLAKRSITHVIYPDLTVQDHSELTASMLITPLRQHSVILEKPWLNWHRVVLDIKSDSLLFVPSQCSHFGAPKVPESQKSELLEELHVINLSIKTVPILKVIKILRRLLNSDKLNWTEEMRPQESTNRIEETRFKGFTKIMKSRDFSIAMMRAAAFQTAAHQKETQLFSITLSELDKQLSELKDDIQLNKISRMTENKQKNLRTKVPKEFHDFLNVFDRKAAEVLSLNRTYDHKIEIDSDEPLSKSQLYPMSQFKLQKMKEYLKKNLQKGFITLSNASYASLILFAQKSNGDLRFCVDYQKLNSLTKKDQYSLPLINETLTQMIECKFITKFNIIAAFNKLCMNSGSKDLMTFITSMRLYKYCVLPFDLMNRSALYQHYMNNILLPFLNDFIQIYLDDIIIYSKTWKEHTQHIWTVLQKLCETDLQVNIKKSEFYV